MNKNDIFLNQCDVHYEALGQKKFASYLTGLLHYYYMENIWMLYSDNKQLKAPQN